MFLLLVLIPLVVLVSILFECAECLIFLFPITVLNFGFLVMCVVFGVSFVKKPKEVSYEMKFEE